MTRLASGGQKRMPHQPVTPDGRYFVVQGRLWRMSDPALETAQRESLVKQLMDARAADVLQPDIYWAGGITEMLKILALASAYDLPVIPHGSSTPASIHLIAAQPEPLMPMLEYLIKWNDVLQWFLKTPIEPKNGFVEVPDEPGIGMELDDAKIDERRELRW